MVGWYHQLSRHEFEQSLGDSKRQGSDEVDADLNLGLLQSMGLQRLGHVKRLNNNKQISK